MSNPIANAVYKTSLWAKLRRYILVNPDELVDFDVYQPNKYRFPAPGSQAGSTQGHGGQPPAYQRPTSPADKVAANRYYNRDPRRADLGKQVVFTAASVKQLADPATANLPATQTAAGILAAIPPTPGKPFNLKLSPDSYHKA